MFSAASLQISIADRPEISIDSSIEKSVAETSQFSLTTPIRSKASHARIALATELSTLANAESPDTATTVPTTIVSDDLLNRLIPN